MQSDVFHKLCAEKPQVLCIMLQISGAAAAASSTKASSGRRHAEAGEGSRPNARPPCCKALQVKAALEAFGCPVRKKERGDADDVEHTALHLRKKFSVDACLQKIAPEEIDRQLLPLHGKRRVQRVRRRVSGAPVQKAGKVLRQMLHVVENQPAGQEARLFLPEPPGMGKRPPAARKT